MLYHSFLVHIILYKTIPVAEKTAISTTYTSLKMTVADIKFLVDPFKDIEKDHILFS